MNITEPGASLDAENVGGADAARFCGGASDLGRYAVNVQKRSTYEQEIDHGTKGKQKS